MQPDWENFAKAVLTDWPTGDLDGSVLFDLSLQYGMIQEVPGGYNSDHYFDADGIGPEEGDPWYEYTFRGEAGPGLYSITDMTKRIEELEAKLAQQGDWVPDARATIAELTGGKESDLKPCPFCGGEAIVDDSAGVSRQCLELRIFCGNEDCLVKPHIYHLYHTAIDAWNNRTTLAELKGGKNE